MQCTTRRGAVCRVDFAIHIDKISAACKVDIAILISEIGGGVVFLHHLNFVPPPSPPPLYNINILIINGRVLYKGEGERVGGRNLNGAIKQQHYLFRQ